MPAISDIAPSLVLVENRDLSPPAARPARAVSLAPLLLVAAAVVWNLISLRAVTFGVAYLDDSSIHEQMVRFATAQFQAGHFPLTSWFPYLGLGSPQFLHYQSLPAMIAGLAGVVIGANAAFSWSMYLLLSLWPITIYFAARLFGAPRWAAGAAAAMSPFLSSMTGIGYETKAYLWVGFGVWTQLWASMTLPLAWGFSWRAIRDGKHVFAAVALTALTVALHFETGYLALIPLLLWPFVATGPAALRARRAAILLVGSLLASAWVIVPLLDLRAWAARNEVLQGTGLVNGYGAGHVLGWLASGKLLDDGRVPIVTVFAAIGLVLALARLKRDPNARALVVVFVVALLLSFGRATFGSLVAVLPGSGDIFFRRFMMGVQLASLLLAGGGAAWAGSAVWDALEELRDRHRSRPWERHSHERQRATSGAPLRAALAIAALVIVLEPAWARTHSLTSRNAKAVETQQRADATDGAELDRLIGVIKANGGGRVYAGEPSNWGANFTVGAVPVFKYLESRDVDEVGYTLRTASLMTIPEYYFDEVDPGDYSLFGVRYLILPRGWHPPVPARLVFGAGPYWLWTTGAPGYVHVGRIVGTLVADRTNVGTRSIPLLRSRLAQHSEYLRTRFGRGGLDTQPLPKPAPAPDVGRVIAETDNLPRGQVTATVAMQRPGTVVLSASFDPGWTASVDDHAGKTEMVAPALVATTVPAGTHTVVFTYHGYGGYPALLALSALTLIVLLAFGDRLAGRPDRRRA